MVRVFAGLQQSGDQIKDELLGMDPERRLHWVELMAVSGMERGEISG